MSALCLHKYCDTTCIDFTMFASKPQSKDSVDKEQVAVNMADPIPPGQRWLKTMEKLYLLHPSMVNRQRDLKYWTGSTIVILSNLLGALRFAIGVFHPEVGLSMANFFNVFGFG